MTNEIDIIKNTIISLTFCKHLPVHNGKYGNFMHNYYVNYYKYMQNIFIFVIRVRISKEI